MTHKAKGFLPILQTHFTGEEAPREVKPAIGGHTAHPCYTHASSSAPIKGSPRLSTHTRSFMAHGGPQKPARLLDGQHGDLSLQFPARSGLSGWSCGSVPSKTSYIGWRRISQPTDRQSDSCSRARSLDHICHFTLSPWCWWLPGRQATSLGLPD